MITRPSPAVGIYSSGCPLPVPTARLPSGAEGSSRPGRKRRLRAPCESYSKSPAGQQMYSRWEKETASANTAGAENHSKPPPGGWSSRAKVKRISEAACSSRADSVVARDARHRTAAEYAPIATTPTAPPIRRLLFLPSLIIRRPSNYPQNGVRRVAHAAGGASLPSILPSQRQPAISYVANSTPTVTTAAVQVDRKSTRLNS